MIEHKDGIQRSRSGMNSNLTQAGNTRCRLIGVYAAGLVLTAGMSLSSATAQVATGPTAEPTAAADEGMDMSPSSLRLSIRQMDATAKQITLTAGRSAVVDLSEPIVRAQVANPDVADVMVLSPRQILVTSQGVGQTDVILWDREEKQVAMSVVVETDMVKLVSAISNMAPGSDVQARAVKDSVVLTGTVPDADTAARIVELGEIFSPKVHNHMKVAGMHQVLLRCTIAEVNRRAIRQLGVNGWLAGDNVRDMFAVNQLDGINPVNIGGGPIGNIIRSGGIPFATDEEGLVLQATPTMSLGFPRVQMQLFFQALRENNLLRVLAEPNLVAMSGQEASFLAGGEFPVPIPQGFGETITIEFREYGIRLKFTPTVIGNQKIRLTVAPEVSEPDFTTAVQFSGFVIPGLTQRKAETTVELASGTTIAMAGLLSEEVRAVSRAIPGLGEVPVLGALFRSVNFQRNKTELVILVTPELATGMHPDQVAPVPGQFITDPDDFELYGLGMVEGEPAPETLSDEAALETHPEPKYRKFRCAPDEMPLHGPWGPAEPEETVQ